MNNLGKTIACCTTTALLLAAHPLLATSVTVPNGSFESPKPANGFPVSIQIDNWQKGPKPDVIQLPDGFTWDQTSGAFPNTEVGKFDHINNLDGDQGVYMFSIPGVSLYQSLDAKFLTGSAYNLSFGILGGGGIVEGSTFEASLYYISDAGAPINLASKTVSYSSSAFPTITDLTGQSFSLGEVKAGDAWAGKSIGIQLVSTFGMGVGYWDVDNVRLDAVPEPSLGALAGLALGSLWFKCRRKSQSSL